MASTQRKNAKAQQDAWRKKRDQLAARLAVMNRKISTAKRKADTRRKIVVGAGVLAHARIDGEFDLILRAALKESLSASDKTLIADASTSENRVRIILGGACLAQAKQEQAFARDLIHALRKAVTAARDKEAINDLLGEEEAAEIAPQKSAA